jgi:ATP-binding protein involved in chromosome partitioning
MSIGFLIDADNPMVWRGPMATSAMEQLLQQTNWQDLDYLIVDMPPGTGDIQLTLSQKVPVTGAIVVTTPQDIALLDAKKGLKMFEKVGIPILGIVENMAYFIPEEMPDNKYFLFGKEGGRKLAQQIDVAFLGEIPLVQAVGEAGEIGEPIILNDAHPTAKAFQSIVSGVAQQIAILNSTPRETVLN